MSLRVVRVTPPAPVWWASKASTMVEAFLRSRPKLWLGLGSCGGTATACGCKVLKPSPAFGLVKEAGLGVAWWPQPQIMVPFVCIHLLNCGYHFHSVSYVIFGETLRWATQRRRVLTTL